MNFLRKYFPYFIVLLNLSFVVNQLTFGGKLGIIYTILINIIIGIASLFFYIKNFNRLNKIQPFLSFIYFVIVLYLILGLIKLIFIPSGIYPAIQIYFSMGFLSFGSYFFIASPRILNRILKLWFKLFPSLFLVFYFVLEPSKYVAYFGLYTFFVLLYPLLPRNRKYVVIVISLFLLFKGIIQRMDIITLLLPILITFSYSMGWLKSKNTFIFVNKVLLIIPFVFFILAFTTNFNVLAIDKYVADVELSSGDKLNNDTRTGLYQESLISAFSNNYFLWGRTPLYGYDSNFQLSQNELITGNVAKMVNGRAQRLSEVFIVNIFTWYGLLGVVLFFIFFYRISHRAIIFSNNIYMKVLGLYVTCFWLTDWISHNMAGVSLEYVLLFIIIGMTYSPHYMKMTNAEFEVYFRKILK